MSYVLTALLLALESFNEKGSRIINPTPFDFRVATWQTIAPNIQSGAAAGSVGYCD